MSRYIKGVQIYHVNTRSLMKKVSQLEILYPHADFLCCSETWLDNRVSNSLININNMTCIRKDRKSDVKDYKIHIFGGGVCIYIADKWNNYTSVVDYGTTISEHFEILTIEVHKPCYKKMIISVVYKPPKGKIDKCLDFLKRILTQGENKMKEFWILGDFNVDLLKRDNLETIRINRFCKNSGLKQLISNITRPNTKGGSCIDYIITNSLYVSEHGVTNDLVADHYTVYCVRKKARENHDTTFKSVRDYSKFDQKVFETLIKQADWVIFDAIIDPNVQWDIMMENILKILA